MLIRWAPFLIPNEVGTFFIVNEVGTFFIANEVDTFFIVNGVGNFFIVNGVGTFFIGYEVDTFFLLLMGLKNYCLRWKNQVQRQFFTDKFVHCCLIYSHHVQYLGVVLPSYSNSFHLGTCFITSFEGDHLSFCVSKSREVPFL